MALSKRYNALLLKANLHPLQKQAIRKNCNKSSDFQLVAMHSAITQLLIERGILDNE